MVPIPETESFIAFEERVLATLEWSRPRTPKPETRNPKSETRILDLFAQILAPKSETPRTETPKP